MTNRHFTARPLSSFGFLPGFLSVLLLMLMLLRAGTVAADPGEATNALPGRSLIVTGRMLPRTLGEDLRRQMATLIQSAPDGHRVVVVTGPDHTTLVNFPVHGKSVRERLRSRAVRQALQQLDTFLTAAATDRHPTDQQVGLPNLPATYWSTATDSGPCRIIVLGDPVYFDARHPFWSFRDGRFPSDEAIRQKTSGCPFLNLRHRPIPAHVEITLVCPTNWGLDQRHRDHVIRWLRLATQESLGGTLIRVTDDVPTAFRSDPRALAGYSRVLPDGQSLVGMWRLARDVRQSSFPETTAPSLPSRPQHGTSPGTTDSAPHPRDSRDAGRSRTPAPETSPSGPNERSMDSNNPQETPLKPLPDTGTAHSEACPADRTPHTPSPQKIPAAETPVPDVSDLSRNTPLDGIQHVTLIDVGGGASASGSPDVRPESDRQAQDAQVRPITTEMDSTTDREMTASDRLNRLAAIAKSRGYPRELQQQLEAAPPGHLAVIVNWTSDCPHADVNLFITDCRIHRDAATGPERRHPEPWEWGVAPANTSDCWINLFATHRPVTATVDVIDLQTGTHNQHTVDLGQHGDRGEDHFRPHHSRSWCKLTLRTTDPATP